MRVTDRSPEAEAKRKAANDKHHGRMREESAKKKGVAEQEMATPAQLKYLVSGSRSRR
ncbi:hypothetical protein OG897_30400 [Streptomyces sp. NBC_00237]|uniref:hypothetical protein n=1 Tax=Streptomyces sp. NBC_00237 TaxID=2975687 RepID=UPI00225AACED|nr:hypothetical protein [Streptomyces sp. NBC_00237]MCX5205751.1 hypothetical protein [Streptomyces sp. NBC_00237]